jgi:hypothetical protein
MKKMVLQLIEHISLYSPNSKIYNLDVDSMDDVRNELQKLLEDVKRRHITKVTIEFHDGLDKDDIYSLVKSEVDEAHSLLNRSGAEPFYVYVSDISKHKDMLTFCYVNDWIYFYDEELGVFDNSAMFCIDPMGNLGLPTWGKISGVQKGTVGHYLSSKQYHQACKNQEEIDNFLYDVDTQNSYNNDNDDDGGEE